MRPSDSLHCDHIGYLIYLVLLHLHKQGDLKISPLSHPQGSRTIDTYSLGFLPPRTKQSVHKGTAAGALMT